MDVKRPGCGKILIVQTAFLGDVVLTTPLFREVKRLFPQGKLTVVATPQGCELLSGLKEIDSLIPYDKNGSERGIAAYSRLIGRLRNEHFDICISPHRSYRTALMVFLSGIRERAGFSDASLSFLYNIRVRRDKVLHEVERILSLLTPVSPSPQSPPVKGGEDKPPFIPPLLKGGKRGVAVDGQGEGAFDKAPYLEISHEIWTKTKELFVEAGISSEDTVIGIAPGSAWATKRWTAEGYASLINRLIGEFNAKVVLIGSPDDRETGDAVLSLCKNMPVNLIGKTSLRELAAVISRFRLFIGNDSAPGHIASAMMVPVVSIFGPTVPSFGYAPYGKDVVIIEKELACRPCHHHGPRKCPEGHFRCMRDIALEEVMVGVEKLLHKRDLQR